jgi:hypothetical protein
MKLIPVLCLSLATVFSGAAFSQKLAGVKVDTPQAMSGKAAQISVAFDIENSANCGVRVNWGDGSGDDFKIEDASKSSYTFSHTYAKAGDFKIDVVPQRVTSRLPCLGKTQSTVVKVSAPTPAPTAAATMPAAAAPAATVAAANVCPAGWTLNAKSVNKKTKAYSCTAKPGTAAPEKKLACEGATGYFENVKKGVIGCQA